MLKIAFKNPVSESNYHDIVQCLREYDKMRDPVETEKHQLRLHGWPETYHPCDHMDNVRWGFVFVDVSNKDILEGEVSASISMIDLHEKTCIYLAKY